MEGGVDHRLSKYDPKRGKWKLGQVIKEYRQNTRGDITLSELLIYLRARGYLVDATSRILDQFVDVDEDGHIHRKIGGSS